jgi:hypothetical protein
VFNDPNLPASVAPGADAITVRPGPPAWQPPGMRQRLLPIAFVVVAVIVYSLLHPKPNVNEQVATQITNAVIANNMQPVANDFNAITREKVEDRGTVGQLSQQLNDLGKLESLKEDTPKEAEPRYHRFVVRFDKATWIEDMTYDLDGKIKSFRIHPPKPNGQ